MINEPSSSNLGVSQRVEQNGSRTMNLLELSNVGNNHEMRDETTHMFPELHDKGLPNTIDIQKSTLHQDPDSQIRENE